jgi:hypothetical protein
MELTGANCCTDELSVELSGLGMRTAKAKFSACGRSGILGAGVAGRLSGCEIRSMTSRLTDGGSSVSLSAGKTRGDETTSGSAGVTFAAAAVVAICGGAASVGTDTFICFADAVCALAGDDSSVDFDGATGTAGTASHASPACRPLSTGASMFARVAVATGTLGGVVWFAVTGLVGGHVARADASIGS